MHQEAAQDVRHFARECDLVMKGGITSGVVYPLAIAEIAKAFRLRSIGGTSAGAIAAAAAAAAELGRQRLAAGDITDDPKGFEQLAELPGFLGGPAASGRATRLSALFKPARSLRKLFGVFLDASAVDGRGRVLAAMRALIVRYKAAALLGLLAGLVPVVLLPIRLASLPAALALVMLALVLMLAVPAAHALIRCLRTLPVNGYGFCSGMPESDDGHPGEALTLWLTDYLDALCGQRQCDPSGRRPLTFGDLRKCDIELRMITTSLTLGRPFRLPFGDDDDVRENGRFLFDPREFRRLFPEQVVAWMIDHATPPRKNDFFDGIERGECLGLPAPDDLPVIVAVRMSLSFPLLLSAVPLHSVDRKSLHHPHLAEQASPSPPLKTCWFTDGGVGSNFPIHFFDAPLPTRPTFGLDLGVARAGAGEAEDVRVLFPQDNRDACLSPWWAMPDDRGAGWLAPFLMRMVNVAKDWNHESLATLPGFRDRIGLILLTEEEGGLNLSMGEQKIQRLAGYGRVAGRRFVERFGAPEFQPVGSVPSDMGWDNHQAVRLRLMLASISEMLGQLDKAMAKAEKSGEGYGRFFEKHGTGYAYPFSGLGRFGVDAQSGVFETQAGLAKWMIESLRAIASRTDGNIHHDAPRTSNLNPRYRSPRPRPELKTRPRI